VTFVVRHAALTDIGLHRSGNEDAFVDELPLVAVADGMGGAQAGEIASHLALDTLAAALDDGAALADAAQAANEAVYRESRTDRARSGMGTTLTAALLADERLVFAHVGDSRLYLWRDETLQQLTDDHSLVGEMVREGHLTREAAVTHPQRSILSRALGTEPRVEIDGGELELRAGDTLLLCSDGLYSMVPELTIAAVLAAVDDPLRVARRLVREAKNEGGHDNITVIVLRLDQAADDEATAVGDGATGVEARADDATAGSDATDDDATGSEPTTDSATTDDGPDESAAVTGDLAAADAAGATDDSDARNATADDDAAADAAEGDAVADEPADAAADEAAGTTAAVGDTAPAPRRRRRRRFWVAGVVALLLLVCAAAGVVASDVYFVGDHDGMVSVYRGLPVSVAGIDLNGLYLQTTMPLVTVAPSVRARVERHDLHRKAAALALARQAQAVP
jgi:PPM family protein phosphatase